MSVKEFVIPSITPRTGRIYTIRAEKDFYYHENHWLDFASMGCYNEKKGAIFLKPMEKIMLGLAHFWVDFTCAALLNSFLGHYDYWQLLACTVLYNGLAFAFQLPIGALADKLGFQRGLAALGCVLVAVGAFIPQPFVVCCLIGAGNACFHVGGGREVLHHSRGLAGPVGQFVAPGALGIFLGPKLASFPSLLRWMFPLVLLGMAEVLFLSRRKPVPQPQPALPLSRLKLIGALGCMFLTVLLRSYMGTVLGYSFLSNVWLALVFTLCIFGGKFFGGSLADRFGTLRFSTAAQILCILLFVLSVWVPLLALPAIFLFNTTMAVTATQLYKALPQYPGTMFGITTFALYLGVLPRLLKWENIFFNWWGLGLLSLLSAAALLGGLVLMRGGNRCDGNPAVPGALTGSDTAV